MDRFPSSVRPAVLLSEFAESPELQKLKADNKIQDLFKWTEETAAKSPVGGGAAAKTAARLDAVIKKAMVWEIWNRIDQRSHLDDPRDRRHCSES